MFQKHLTCELLSFMSKWFNWVFDEFCGILYQRGYVKHSKASSNIQEAKKNVWRRLESNMNLLSAT